MHNSFLVRGHSAALGIKVVNHGRECGLVKAAVQIIPSNFQHMSSSMQGNARGRPQEMSVLGHSLFPTKPAQTRKVRSRLSRKERTYCFSRSDSEKVTAKRGNTPCLCHARQACMHAIGLVMHVCRLLSLLKTEAGTDNEGLHWVLCCRNRGRVQAKSLGL